MKSVTYLLAHRYIGNRHHEHTISIMTLIAGISIFIGSFSLALVTAIMNGFEYTVHEKMKNIHPTATIFSRDPLNVEAIKQLIIREFPAITGMSPTALGHVLINVPDDQSQPIVALMKGVDPAQEAAVSAIGTKFIPGTFFEQSVHDNAIAIGKELARSLGVSVGDSLSLLYLESPDTSHKKVTVEHIDAIVGGIFDTGIDEYDGGVIYCTLPFFTQLFPQEGITHLGIACRGDTDVTQLVRRLHERLGLEVHTWQELYPALFAALVLEKYAMFFILLLITLVASMNIIALIFMLISHKKSDIAILRALGMSSRHIQYLFMFIGITLASLAAFFGVGAAWITSMLLEKYPFIQLPDVYYVSHLPARMTFTIATIVFCAVLFIAWVASWFATRRISTINVSHTLRFEG